MEDSPVTDDVATSSSIGACRGLQHRLQVMTSAAIDTCFKLLDPEIGDDKERVGGEALVAAS